MTTIKKTLYFNSESPGFKYLDNGELLAAINERISNPPSWLFQGVLDAFFDACNLSESREELESRCDIDELHDSYLQEVTITIECKTLGVYSSQVSLLPVEPKPEKAKPTKATKPTKSTGLAPKKRALKKAPK